MAPPGLPRVARLVAPYELAWRSFRRPPVVVLSYQHVEAASLHAHLSHLGERFQFVDLHDLLRPNRACWPLRPSVAVTFDDGYRCCYTDALPVLQRLGVPATVFVVTEFVDTGRSFWWDRLAHTLAHSPVRSIELDGRRHDLDAPCRRDAFVRRVRALVARLPADECAARLDDLLRRLAEPAVTVSPDTRLMGWEELRRLRAAGIHVESHTATHAALGVCGRAVARGELEAARCHLQRELGEPPRLLAYPYGGRCHSSPAIRRLAAETGHWAAVTMLPGVLRQGGDPFLVPRVRVGPREALDVLGLKVSALWPVASRLQAALRASWW